MKRFLWNLFFYQTSYKVVALLISCVLWGTILGKRDFSVSRSVDLDFRTSMGLQVLTQSTDSVKVKLVGPRASLQKFLESGQSLVVDLTDKKSSGLYQISLEGKKMDLPFGVKVMSINPSQIDVSLSEK